MKQTGKSSYRSEFAAMTDIQLLLWVEEASKTISPRLSSDREWKKYDYAVNLAYSRGILNRAAPDSLKHELVSDAIARLSR
jgi:hypothetical protein